MAVLSGVEFVTAIEDRLHSSRRGSLAAGGAGLRFAFYGRMSTSEFQDVDTSWAWQRAVADELIEGFGTIVAEYFDEGRSRRWAWPDRPAAAALAALAAARRPDRTFDAVVVGEYERGFSGISSSGWRPSWRRWVCRWLPKAGDKYRPQMTFGLNVYLTLPSGKHDSNCRERGRILTREFLPGLGWSTKFSDVVIEPFAGSIVLEMLLRESLRTKNVVSPRLSAHDLFLGFAYGPHI